MVATKVPVPESVEGQDEERARVDLELTRALFEQGPATLGIGVACLILCASLLYGFVEAGPLVIWLVVGLSTVALRAPLMLLASSRRTEQLPYRLNMFLVACSGMVWGSLALFWSPELQMSAKLLLVLCPLLISVGVVSSYGPRLPLYFAFALPAQLPFIVLFLTTDVSDEVRLALPCVMFIIGQGIVVKRYNASYREMARLKMRNERMATDLSEQNQALAEARDEAQIASIAKSEFLARMSHEIRTPMNGVLGTADLLSRSALDGTQQTLLATLRESGDSLMVLIDRLLDISRVERHEFEINETEYEPRSLIADLREHHLPMIERAALRLDAEIAADVPARLYGDHARLREALSNLLDNAIRFTAGGHVGLYVGCERAENSPAMLVIRVSDTGVGIPNDQQETVFEPFRQGDGSSTRRIGGSGLGLALVREIAQLMDGSVSLESEVGVGSTFTLRLPLNAAASATAMVDVAAVTPRTVDARVGRSVAPLVLVAEDNPVNQMVIEAMLEGFGCHVHLADDGAQALVALGEVVYDLVFMDCQMPGVDGFDATRTARAQGHTLPIVAVTANAMPGDRERCLGAGMDDYLSKPFTNEDLGDMLGRWGFPVNLSTAA